MEVWFSKWIVRAAHTDEQRLSGETFMLHWEGHSLGLLFRKIQDTMPPDGIDRVTEEEKLAAMAFVLARNGFPAGSIDLTRDSDVLAGIEILPKGADNRCAAVPSLR